MYSQDNQEARVVSYGEREAEGCDRPLILGTEREDGTVPFGTANKAQVPLGHRVQG